MSYLNQHFFSFARRSEYIMYTKACDVMQSIPNYINCVYVWIYSRFIHWSLIAFSKLNFKGFNSFWKHTHTNVKLLKHDQVKIQIQQDNAFTVSIRRAFIVHVVIITSSYDVDILTNVSLNSSHIEYLTPPQITSHIQ